MCGIVGYVGPRQATEVLFGGLARLEYRGYDSAGIAIAEQGHVEVRRREGELENLVNNVSESPMSGHCGIGHTRWATHGRPSEKNAHPHRDCKGEIALVHNGIIENYAKLRERLLAEGHVFRSETDTEVLVHLIESYYSGDLLVAVSQALKEVTGAYAIAVVSAHEPERIVAARKDSPLIIGTSKEENFVASDVAAVIEYTRDVIALANNELALVQADGVTVYDEDLNIVEDPEKLHVDWDIAAAEKGGYEHFMLKEMHEQPEAIRATLAGRFVDGKICMSEINLAPEELANIERVFIVACGTSYHAGLVAKTLIERWAKIPVEVQVSSEFRYSYPLIDEKTLVVAITQSGETADTLTGVEQARAHKAKAFAITNVVGSRVARESDGVIYTHAGPERGVAATKTFTAQIVALYSLALYLAQTRGTLSSQEIEHIFNELETLPDIVEAILARANEIEAMAGEYIQAPNSLFLGRGIGVPIAMEGALKLKEISYIHAEAYAAGEMKHGPIALIDESCPVVAIACESETYDKLMSNVSEVDSRGARVILVATDGDETARRVADHVLYVPRTSELLSAIPATIPLQLLSYFISVKRGLNPDMPRNLAKSVTVE